MFRALEKEFIINLNSDLFVEQSISTMSARILGMKKFYFSNSLILYNVWVRHYIDDQYNAPDYVISNNFKIYFISEN